MLKSVHISMRQYIPFGLQQCLQLYHKFNGKEHINNFISTYLGITFTFLHMYLNNVAAWVMVED
jgi:hypothetical protein